MNKSRKKVFFLIGKREEEERRTEPEKNGRPYC
jgi:hypothetical protein